MADRLCSECKNHYIKGGWHCWSGNKSLGFCNQNGTPHPKAKHWRYSCNRVRSKVVEYKDIERIKKYG